MESANRSILPPPFLPFFLFFFLFFPVVKDFAPPSYLLDKGPFAFAFLLTPRHENEYLIPNLYTHPHTRARVQAGR